MNISPVNNIQFGRLRIKTTPINHSYIDGLVNKDTEVLEVLNDSLSKINAKTGEKRVDFRVDLNGGRNNIEPYWTLNIVDPLNANVLSRVDIERKASREDYIKNIKLLALNTPKYNTVSSVSELIRKFQ